MYHSRIYTYIVLKLLRYQTNLRKLGSPNPIQFPTQLLFFGLNYAPGVISWQTHLSFPFALIRIPLHDKYKNFLHVHILFKYTPPLAILTPHH